MKTNKTKKPRTHLENYIESRGIVRAFIAKKIGISYPRFRTILNGADPYLKEAVKMSEVLDTPLDSLFPHLFHTQVAQPSTKSHA